MRSNHSFSRRTFLSLAAATPLLAQKGKQVPVGLELYSVRDELKQDLEGTVRGVAQMGYKVVEFFSPYYSWSTEQTKDVRKLLDDLNIRCLSTHNGANAFATENLQKSIELNSILGSKQVVMASAGRVQGADGWQKVAERLSAASEAFTPAGLSAGFHNHQIEFRPLEGGTRPMDILAKNTPKQVVLQLDVGTCVEVGVDPVKWIESNPGRIRSIHLKEYSPEPGKGYKVLFGEGAAPWKKIFAAAEKVGGVEFYLIEQEGSEYPPMETAQRCLAAYKKMRGIKA
jgi:sugar phosphate isomerase/epimerase